MEDDRSSFDSLNANCDGYNLLTNPNFSRTTDLSKPINHEVLKTSNDDAIHDPSNIAHQFFEKILPQLDTYYEGHSERMLISKIFEQIKEIGKTLELNEQSLPVGVFCTTRQDLIKLDLFLNQIKFNIKPQRSVKSRLINLCKKCKVFR